FARSVELRLGEYLETYDDERMKAVESAYRNGDIDRQNLLAVGGGGAGLALGSGQGGVGAAAASGRGAAVREAAATAVGGGRGATARSAAAAAAAPGVGVALSLEGAAAGAKTRKGGPETLSPRPGSASLPGFDEDDLNTSRTYWEPSVAPVGLVSPEMVKLKVEMLAVALCLPQQWERVNAVRSVSSRGRIRQRPAGYENDDDASTAASAAASAAATEARARAMAGAAPDGQRPISPVAMAPGEFFQPSRVIAPELAAALKEAVEEQEAYKTQVAEAATSAATAASAGGKEEAVDGDDDDEVVDIGMDVTNTDGGAGAGAGAGTEGLSGDRPGSDAAEAAPGEAPPVSPAKPEVAPEPVVPDQPFVRKAQGKWASVESSSDEEDFGAVEEDEAVAEEVEAVGEEAPAAAAAAAAAAAPATNSSEVSGGDPSDMAVSTVEPAATTAAAAAAAAVSGSDTVVTPATTPNSGAAPEPGATAAAPAAATPVSFAAVLAPPAPGVPTAMKVDEPRLSPSSPPAALAPSVRPPAQPEALIQVTDAAAEVQPKPEQQATQQKQKQQAVLPITLPPPAPEPPRVQVVSMLVDLEDWRERVRRADATEQLAILALELDYAIPREEGWLEQWYKTENFAEPRLGGGSSLAAAATRVFALDRALRWDIIPRPRRGGSRLPGDLPRAWSFFYQCPLSPLCMRPCMHKGKCKAHRTMVTRVDHPIIVPESTEPAPYLAQHATGQAAAAAAAHSASYSYTPAAPVPAPAPQTPAHSASFSHVYATPPVPAVAPSPAPATAPTPAPAPPAPAAPPPPTYTHQLFARHTAQAQGTGASVPAPATGTVAAAALSHAIHNQQHFAAAQAAALAQQASARVTPAVDANTPVAAPVAYQHPSPATGQAREGVAAAVAAASAAAGVGVGGGNGAAGSAPQPTTAAAPAGLNLAVPRAGLPLWFQGLQHATPEQMRDFQAKIEAAARNAWAATARGAAGEPQPPPATPAQLLAAHHAASQAASRSVGIAPAASHEVT
ncbi:unnamed protein product, partial [Ectocarpus sp. 8 AP-2014]